MKRSRLLRWPILLIVLAVLLASTSGCVCGGSPQASSWTGLTLKDGKIYVSDLQQIQILGTDGERIQSIPENTDNSPGLLQIAPAVDEDYLIVAAQMPARGLFSQATNPVVRLDIETGNEKWRFEEAQGQYVESGVIAITDGADIFVIGNSDSNVYALDVDTGDLKWQFETGHRVWATPLIAGDTVYIGSMDHHLYALRLLDGKEIWKFPADKAADGAFASTPTLQDGVLYIGTFANRVYAIDANDGTEIWRFPAEKPGENWFWGSPAVDGGAVYAVDVKGNVYKLDAGTGEEIWHSKLGPKKNNEKDAPVRGGPALTEDGGTLLINSEDGTLYALDVEDGSEEWFTKGEGKGYVTPVVDGDIVYQALIHGSYRIRALEITDDGDELWVYPLPEESETGE
ncbi:MAG: PQQ-binding-like beta-propeller repeat protein [Anaerolineae bacterium]|nr:PQQ-binding-like beta-propeller repeat protein [Anaerolineae bacterium]